jgi:hypothetical protein
MFKTNNLKPSSSTSYIYRHFEEKLNPDTARMIIGFLERYRSYNIQLVGPKIEKDVCFTRKLTKNITVKNGRPEGTIVFPTNIGKIAFNIRESKYHIKQLDDHVSIENAATSEWKDTDAFFVMFSLTTDVINFKNDCSKWIQCIRESFRTLERDVPIILVGVKCHRGLVDSKITTEDIVEFQRVHNIPYVEVSSKTLHAPFIALQSLLKNTYSRNLLTDDISNIPTTQLSENLSENLVEQQPTHRQPPHFYTNLMNMDYAHG